MLVLTRKIGESIVLDGDIVVKVSQVNGNRVKLCIDAPRECRVVRSEILNERSPKLQPPRTSEAEVCIPATAK